MKVNSRFKRNFVTSDEWLDAAYEGAYLSRARYLRLKRRVRRVTGLMKDIEMRSLRNRKDDDHG